MARTAATVVVLLLLSACGSDGDEPQAEETPSTIGIRGYYTSVYLTERGGCEDVRDIEFDPEADEVDVLGDGIERGLALSEIEKVEDKTITIRNADGQEVGEVQTDSPADLDWAGRRSGKYDICLAFAAYEATVPFSPSYLISVQDARGTVTPSYEDLKEADFQCDFQINEEELNHKRCNDVGKDVPS